MYHHRSESKSEVEGQLLALISDLFLSSLFLVAIRSSLFPNEFQSEEMHSPLAGAFRECMWESTDTEDSKHILNF